MLFPGTFLGVWNLLRISGGESAGSVSATWIQAHGHAQVFGGIGFYSVPKVRGTAKAAFGAAWTCWGMWTVGVGLRWLANVYGWEWRLLVPVSAALELAAFLIFFRASWTRGSGSSSARARVCCSASSPMRPGAFISH
jgi:hypothetical protein